jgi:hypothetical protein
MRLDRAILASDYEGRTHLYEAKVNELLAAADQTADPAARIELFNLCLSYKRLAARLCAFDPTPVEELLGNKPHTKQSKAE